jgi:hypothetical protein
MGTFVLKYQECVDGNEYGEASQTGTETFTKSHEERDQDDDRGSVFRGMLTSTKTRTEAREEEDQDQSRTYAAVATATKTSTATREEPDQDKSGFTRRFTVFGN